MSLDEMNFNQVYDSTKLTGIIFHLADGTIQSCNVNAERILGYTCEQLIGQSSFELPWQTIQEDGSPFRPETYPATLSIETGQPCSNVIMGFYKPNGDLIWLSIDSVPLFKRDHTKAYGVEVTFREVSQQIEGEISFQELPQERRDSPSASSQGQKQLRVLLIEDSLEDREVYRRYLQTNTDYQYHFIEAESGVEALELFNQCQPDIVLLDYMLPDMDGLELLAQWQQQDRELPPVIVLTGQGNEAIAVQFLKLGAADYIVKGQLTPDKLNLEVKLGISEWQLHTQNQTNLIALQPNRQFAQKITNVVPGIIYIHDVIAQKNIYLNSQTHSILGYSPQQIFDMGADFLPQVMHPEDLARFPSHLEKLACSQEEKVCNFEYRMRHQNGEWHWFFSRDRVYQRTEDGRVLQILGTAQDISERKELEAQLIHTQQHLRRVLDSLSSFIAVLNPDGILIEVNRTALEAANLSSEDGIGKPFAQTYWWSYSTESQTQLNNAIERAKTGEAVRYDVKLRLSEENYIIIDLALVPLFDEWGNLEYIIFSGIEITERKQAEKARQKSEEQLRKMLDTLPVYVGLLTPDGKVVSINQTALEGIDMELEDLIERPFAETPWWSIEIQAKIKDAIKRAAAGEAVGFDTLSQGGGEGNQILVEFSMIPLFDDDGQVEYLVPSAINITEREQNRLALEQREYELRLITEVIPQQIWTALPNGETDYFNQRWQDYTGLTVEQANNRGWEQMIHPDALQEVNEIWNGAITTGCNCDLEMLLRRADGEYRWFLVRARPLRNERGEIIKWYGTNTDINQIKELEAKLQQQTQNLIHANQLKDEFLAIVSHELRTPLNPILGWSQLLASGILNPEKTARGLEIIQRNAQLQAQLIDDLLDVSRILRGKINLQHYPLNLELVIRSAISTVQLAAEAKLMEIETVFESNIGQVLGDADRLQQIVWNLISNAIKFTPEGGRITVTLERAGTQALIQVKDTGKGIVPEFLPYVFDRFRQEEKSTTRRFGGLGLGLAIVRHLTELHGGTVAADSPGEGKGATFSVKLPLLKRPQRERSNGEALNEPVKTSLLNGIRVLIVDDEADSLDLLSFVLEQKGAEVTPVLSAQEALEAFNCFTPDLIISDIGMPEVDGYTLINQIRQLPQGKNLPAIALTAYAGEAAKQRSRDFGYQQHIAKPINITNLLAVITQLI